SLDFDHVGDNRRNIGDAGARCIFGRCSSFRKKTPARVENKYTFSPTKRLPSQPTLVDSTNRPFTVAAEFGLFQTHLTSTELLRTNTGFCRRNAFRPNRVLSASDHRGKKQRNDERCDVAHSRIVIVGGGFGGLAAAKALRKAPAEVVLIDRTNHHVFQPLLYQV